MAVPALTALSDDKNTSNQPLETNTRLIFY
jgi:hypothetical protein